MKEKIYVSTFLVVIHTDSVLNTLKSYKTISLTFLWTNLDWTRVEENDKQIIEILSKCYMSPRDFVMFCKFRENLRHYFHCLSIFILSLKKMDL